MIDTMARVEGRNVSMYPSDWLIVEEADQSSAGISATMRRIVREWNYLRSCSLLPRGLNISIDPNIAYITTTDNDGEYVAGGNGGDDT